MIFIAAFLILCLDQAAKFIITRNLSPGQSVAVIKNIFHLTLVHNRGAAFGVLKSQTFLFILASIFAIILIFLNFKKTGQALYNLSLGLILAGAAGNLIDRLFLGYVVDFLDFRIWPVFNVADSSITIGAILVGYCVLKTESKTLNPKP
jgi:signal peptidase II